VARTGVWICHCGRNIADMVDCTQVREAVAAFPEVSHAEEYKFMCSSPGQQKILDAVKAGTVDRVVVAACSPAMHEVTFRNALVKAGLNPYLLEIANIREHCSWVHTDKAEATAKAVELIRKSVRKLRRAKPLAPIRVPLRSKRVLVIGGGIAGIQAALDVAAGGREVVLLERSPSLGGHMAQLDETFPTLDCSQCIMTPRMVEAGTHPKIELMTYSELERLDGYVGNFTATIRRKARSVDMSKCTGCGDCWNKCPAKKIPNEFNFGLDTRTAIYIPFAQAVPTVPVIDRENCIYFKTGKCGACKKLCKPEAIDFDQQDEVVERQVDAVIVATGYDFLQPTIYPEYGGGKLQDVITSIEFERMVSAGGPKGRNSTPYRPSDGKPPKTVVFVQCAGSRDERFGVPYCSKICCMYTAKHTMFLKHKLHDAQAYVFYIDVRATGKGYEEFVKRAQVDDGAIYMRGRVAHIIKDGDKLLVQGEDSLAGRPVEIAADLVVLAMGKVAQPDATSLAQKVGINYDEYGFFSEAHPKLRPVETTKAGVFLAGCCQFPKDIPDSVAQASAAASKALSLLSQDELAKEPEVAVVDERRCIGCEYCVETCPYGAPSIKEIPVARGSSTMRRVAEVNPGLCEGCGACVALCQGGAVDLDGYTDRQMFEEVVSLCPSSGNPVS